jgi:hypothetical protein
VYLHGSSGNGRKIHFHRDHMLAVAANNVLLLGTGKAFFFFGIVKDA